MVRLQSASLLSPSLLTLLSVSGSAAGWQLQDDYNPSNFFSMFSFWTASDPTHGFVQYVDQNTAQRNGLISSNGQSVTLGVDSKNPAPNGRQSVRLTSRKSYNAGTLVVLDLAHMPHGCGTWPAFWTTSTQPWPVGGEIDIIEGVHNQASNVMTLHTTPGCTLTNNGQFTGSIVTNNCDINAPGQYSNQGCSINTPLTNTYGAGLNAAGGGVYAMRWVSSGISVWFFPRGSIPSDISSGNPAPASWGKPLAMFQGGCDIDKYFASQQIIINVSLGGDWAAEANVWRQSGCQSSQFPTANSFIANNPSAFSEAYWRINGIKVYSQQVGDDTQSTSPPPSSSSSDVPVTSAEAQNQPTQTASQNNDQGQSQNDNNQGQDSSGSPVIPQVGGSGTVVVGDSNVPAPNSVSSNSNTNAGTSGNSATNTGASSPVIVSNDGHLTVGEPSTSGATGNSAPAAPASNTVGGAGMTSPSDTASQIPPAPPAAPAPPAPAATTKSATLANVIVGAGGYLQLSPGRHKRESIGDASDDESVSSTSSRATRRHHRHGNRHGRRQVRPLGPNGRQAWRH